MGRLAYTLIIFFCGCTSLTDQPILRLSLEEQHLLANFSLLEPPNHLQLTPPKEAGTPLIIIGKLLDQADMSPMPLHEILVYQANYLGEYEPAAAADAESSTRLKGVLITDKEGRFQISTILPGNTQPHGTPRIHLLLKGGEPQEQAYYFRQFMSSELIFWAKEQTDQAMIINLRKDKMGRLVGIKDIVLNKGHL